MQHLISTENLIYLLVRVWECETRLALLKCDSLELFSLFSFFLPVFKKLSLIYRMDGCLHCAATGIWLLCCLWWSETAHYLLDFSRVGLSVTTRLPCGRCRKPCFPSNGDGLNVTPCEIWFVYQTKRLRKHCNCLVLPVRGRFRLKRSHTWGINYYGCCLCIHGDIRLFF